LPISANITRHRAGLSTGRRSAAGADAASAGEQASQAGAQDVPVEQVVLQVIVGPRLDQLDGNIVGGCCQERDDRQNRVELPQVSQATHALAVSQRALEHHQVDLRRCEDMHRPLATLGNQQFASHPFDLRKMARDRGPMHRVVGDVQHADRNRKHGPVPFTTVKEIWRAAATASDHVGYSACVYVSSSSM
jgi:hypothetical protein